MNVEEAKDWMGRHYVLHPDYSPEATPWHSMRWSVNVKMTWARVIARRIRERADRQMLRRVA